jgi:hypothetical protein
MSLYDIARSMGATPADIPGLWNLPGYPELTTAQLVQIVLKHMRHYVANAPSLRRTSSPVMAGAALHDATPSLELA